MKSRVGLLSSQLSGLARRIAMELGLPMPESSDQLLSSDRSELRHLLLQRGCPLCRYSRQSEDRTFFWFLMEYYGEAAWIERLVHSGGFCPYHTHRLLETKSVYRLSFVAQYLMEHYLRLFRHLQSSAEGNEVSRRASLRPGGELPKRRKDLLPLAPCPFCELLDQSVTWAASRLVRGLKDPEILGLYRESDGLCMPHFVLAAERASNEVTELLIRQQLAQLEALNSELAEVTAPFVGGDGAGLSEGPFSEMRDFVRKLTAMFSGSGHRDRPREKVDCREEPREAGLPAQKVSLQTLPGDTGTSYTCEPPDREMLDASSALVRNGCPACCLGHKNLEIYFGSLRHDKYRSPGAIRRLRFSRGYCHQHGREAATALEEAQAIRIYREVSARAETELRRLLSGSEELKSLHPDFLHRALGSRHRPLRAMGNCPACTVEEESQARATSALISLLETPEGRELYSQHQGVCVRHLIRLVQKGPPQVVSVVTGHAANRMHALLGEIREYFRKEDYRYAHEPKGEEQTAWVRAFRLLVGQ